LAKQNVFTIFGNSSFCLTIILLLHTSRESTYSYLLPYILNIYG